MTTCAILRLLTVATAVAATVPALLNADTLNLAGVVTISSDGTLGTCVAGSTACQDLGFSGVVLTPASLLFSPLSLTSLGLGFNGSALTFDPSSASFTVGSGATTLSGDINWESLTGTGSGGYQLNFALSNLTSTGSNTVLNDFAAGGGYGSLTFQTPGGPQTISDLLANSGALAPSFSGTLVSTPEPATLSLLTCGFFALGLLTRKRRTS